MTYYTRKEWGSAYPLGGNIINGPVQEVYVHHYNSGILPPISVADAMARVRSAQVFHVETRGWQDIAYSFLIDNFGNIYEGRGWFRTGAHTEGYNSKGYGVCWIGDSFTVTPSTAALRAYADVVNMGIAAGALVPNVQIVASPDHLVAHRDRNPDTSCCGDPMYAQLGEIRMYCQGVNPPAPPTPLIPREEDDDMRFTAFRIPNGAVYVEDLQTGQRRELMSIMPAGTSTTDALNALIELGNAGLVRVGPTVDGVVTPYNGIGWNANWALDELDDVAVGDRVTD